MSRTHKNCSMVLRARAWIYIVTISTGYTLCVTASTLAQGIAPTIETVRSSRTGEVVFIRNAQGGAIATRAAANAPKATPKDFLQEHGRAFGIQDVANQLVEKRNRVDSLGQTHTTFEQMHHGVPVYSGVLHVHELAAGGFSSANGRFHPIAPQLPVIPVLDAAAAERIASAQIPGVVTQAFLNQLVIVDPGWYGDAPKGPRLSYFIKLADNNLEVEEGFFIDATSGEILDRWPLAHHARNRQIYDGGESESLPGTLARVEGQPAVMTPADVNRAYDYYGDTYDFYFRAFGRDSIDGLGLPMVATVRSTAPGCPNAFWSGYLQQMVFCTGTVTDDIVGHELTHGVTELSAGLIYQNQPGALNESMSDIFGELVDLYNGNVAFPPNAPPGPTWPTSHATGPGLDAPNLLRTSCSSISSAYPNGVRWLVGEDAFVFGGAIRDMWAPPCFFDPDSANSPLMFCFPQYDNGGVHFNSGVPNHCFAILVDGTTFNNVTVAGIGPIKAGAVWYRALTTYLTVASDFEDAYLALTQSAQDLIGSVPNDPRTGLPSDSVFTQTDANQVDLACIATNMNGPGICLNNDPVVSSDPPSICTVRTTVFSDNFENGINGWASFVSDPPPDTIYFWQQTSGLPNHRAGTAWFCEDPNFYLCEFFDEAAVHYLISPPISIPSTSRTIYVSFTHLMMSEAGWDGGSMDYSDDGGLTWHSIPREMIAVNPYNGRLRDASQFSNNPLGGQDAWTGLGGTWGTSIIRDNQELWSGKSIYFRFNFSKDVCVGTIGWYVDDFEVYYCSDCANDGIPNDQAAHVSFVSPTIGNIIGIGFKQFPIVGAPIAVSDITLTVLSSADWEGDSKYLQLRLNNLIVGTLFNNFEESCAGSPERATLTIPASTFNSQRSPDGNLSVLLEPSASVGTDQFCTGADGYLGLTLEYETSPETCPGNSQMVLATLPDMSVCFGTASAPLGPEPLVTGGTPPYSFFWQVMDGPSTIPPALATVAHPTMTPTAAVDHLLRVQITDSSLVPQQVAGQFTLRVGTPVEVDPGYYLRYHPIITVGETLAFANQFTITGGREPYEYDYSIIENPNGGGSLNESDPAHATFVASAAGTYTVKLLVKEFGGCTGEAIVSLTADANAPQSRTNTDNGGNGGGSVNDMCGVGTGMCAPTGILTIAGSMIGFGWLRSRVKRRRG
jgi:bacillolysin